MNIGVFMRKAFSTGVTLVTSTLIVGSFSGCSAPAPVADDATSASTTNTTTTTTAPEQSSVLSEATFGDIKNNVVTNETKTINRVTTVTKPATRTPIKRSVVVQKAKTIRRPAANSVSVAAVNTNQGGFSEREEQWLSYQRKWQQEQEQRRNQYAANRAQRANAPRAARQQYAQAQQQQNQAWADAPAQRPQQLIQIAMAPVIDSGRLANAALGRLRSHVTYDGRYVPIGYPNGDVPASIGVCSDVVIRSYRNLGIDLQRLVHEDMTYNFNVYPNLAKWGLSGPDSNIDHRRVHNLKTFFTRYGQRLANSRNPDDYHPGDIVTWSLGGDQEHIGIVSDRYSDADPRRPLIVHHIDARGVQIEDMLFTLPITGHYRYVGGAGRTQMVSM